MNARPSTVYFFSTCVVDLMAPQAGVDAIRVLQEHGIEVVFPQAQSCCGQPAYSSGFLDEARGVAQAQLGIFPERWPIVVPSGSCAGMIKHHWPRLFADDPARLAQAQDIADRVFEWSAFAHEVLGLALPASAARSAPPATHARAPTREHMLSRARTFRPPR